MNIYGTDRNRVYRLLAIAASILIFVILRARWIGHLITWDEAMNLCAVRALASMARDHFSHWLWRHPPLFPVATLLLHPLRQGFAERVEILAVAIGVLNMVLLFMLNSKVFGRTAAVFSIFFLAVMPGSMFFDVWVKRDHTVATFGLTALLLLVSRRPLWAGLSLGFAMLSKETAVFYAIAAGILWLSGAAGKRNIRDLLALTVTPLLASAWWYHLSFAAGETPVGASWLDRLFGSATEHVRLAMNDDSGWARPWDYYLRLLPDMLGTAGLLTAAAGVVATGTLVLRTTSLWRASALDLDATTTEPASSTQDIGCPERRPSMAIDRTGNAPAMLWPLMVIVPSYLLLSCLRSKVPWVPMAMFPAWATLQGVALDRLTARRRTGETAQRSFALPARYALAGLILVGSLHFASRLDYDDMLRAIAPDQQRGAEWSRNAALAMNMAAADTDRVLLTSFHYWQGILPGQACPVFAYYYTGHAAILMKPHETPFTDLVAAIKEHEIDWALLSPAPGAAEQDVFGGFVGKLGLTPIKLERAWLFKTSNMRTGE